jgi:hypothetical protein
MMPTPRVAASFGRHRVVGQLPLAVARHRFVSAQYRHILHMRRGQGLCRAAVPRHLHHRQVAEMSFLLRSLMLAGMLRVEMTSGTAGWHRLAVEVVGWQEPFSWIWKPCGPGGSPFNAVLTIAPPGPSLIVTAPNESPGPVGVAWRISARSSAATPTPSTRNNEAKTTTATGEPFIVPFDPEDDPR